MGYITIAIAVFLLAIFFGFSSGCKKSTGQKAEKQRIESKEETGFMHRSALRNLLNSLSKTKTPEFLGIGAMCYYPTMPPDKIDYNCPKCGSKTHYENEISELEINDKEVKYYDLIESVYDIPNCHRTLKMIRKLDVSLDESQFCKKCSPDIEKPKLVLIVNYEEDKQHRIEGVTNEDLILINEFLSGSNIHKSDMDYETPLKDHIKRLSELLGVEIIIEDEKDKDEK